MARFNLPRVAIVFVILTVFGIATMRFTGLDRSQLSQVEMILRELVAPFQSAMTFVIDKVSSPYKAIVKWEEIARQNEELTARVEKLEFENNRLQEYRLQNFRLKKLLDFKELKEDEYNLTAARVIGRDPSNWYHTITLDVGETDGIRKNMVVINYEGLIGRVIKVTENTAEVLTLFDRASAVGALIQETRVPGVVEPAAGKKGYLQMVHLSHDVGVMKGQHVVTSGLGAYFPKGIRIGIVSEVTLDPSGLVKKAIIRPYVDFNRLEEVLVINDVT